MRITFADMRHLGYCSRGAREWFKQHGLDYQDFVKHGIDAERLKQTGDAMALRVVELAQGRLDHE